MDLDATVLGKSLCECERIELDVGVPMSQALEESSNDISSAKWDENESGECVERDIPLFSFVLDLVTEIEDDFPILRSLVLIRGLD